MHTVEKHTSMANTLFRGRWILEEMLNGAVILDQMIYGFWGGGLFLPPAPNSFHVNEECKLVSSDINPRLSVCTVFMPI